MYKKHHMTSTNFLTFIFNQYLLWKVVNKTFLSAEGVVCELWRRGRSLSMSSFLVVNGQIPPWFRKASCLLTLSKTLRLVWSLGDSYSLIGADKTLWLGLIPAELILRTMDSFWTTSSRRGFRLQNAVMGSATKLGRGTNGNLSQGTGSGRAWFVFECFVNVLI